jgi:molybdopterin-containing oxidoreductase family membrane subunit
MITCNFVVTFPLLCLRRVRRSVPAIFGVSLLVLVGMYSERVLIVVASLARRNDPFIWHNYFPTWVELSITAASFAMFGMLFMVFSKLFPIMAISEIKERLFHTTERAIGSATVETIARVEEHEEGKGK